MPLKLLGGLSPRTFLRRHWQKTPLFVPGALPEFRDLIAPEELIALARSDELPARLVIERDGRWEVRHGPLAARDFRGLKGARWVLLVQNLEQRLPEARALLERFDFLPYARLDDLMVSFAPAGGGVGPHFDSYDVFLLQGLGEKRWQVSAQRDFRVLPDAPLRILQRFHPEQEWVARAGDLLYLPPRYAHHGVALGDCLSYSVGFRAPSAEELVRAFLVYLEEHLEPKGMYADPDLVPVAHPAALPPPMVVRVAEMLAQIRWREREVADFLGCYLTEPKPHVFFTPPLRPSSRARFSELAARHGVRLALKSQMLFYRARVFINGEALDAQAELKPWLRELADRRSLGLLSDAPAALLDLLYAWYRVGWLEISRP